MAANPDVLNSWKEVADYLGRGVRTVQRWERDLNLPVRRPRGTERSAVIALKQELDHWLLQSPAEILKKKAPAFISKTPGPCHNTSTLILRTQALALESNSLCERSRELCQQINHSVSSSIRLMRKETQRSRELRQGINKPISNTAQLMNKKEAGDNNVF
jgi:CHAT domain-containing protein